MGATNKITYSPQSIFGSTLLLNTPEISKMSLHSAGVNGFT